uniref:Uncharacterized protein n=1 Tax=Anguilla anguilla TaxID=7936 RepID=A0A0E9VZJ9_ANGAN
MISTVAVNLWGFEPATTRVQRLENGVKKEESWVRLR